jgi:hypothetical protein
MAHEDDLLNERLANSDNTLELKPRSDTVEIQDPAIGMPAVPTSFDFVQWSAEPNDAFRPSGARAETLPAGVYEIDSDNRGLYFQRKKVITDDLIQLDDSASVRVVANIRKFWASKEQYEKRGIIYKRGILLWGPAGSGKTATLMLLTRELVEIGGIVVIAKHPGMAISGLQQMRRIEPDRPLIVVLEDVDEIIRNYGEHDLLALLDGENQISNVVNLATTNYPEVLGARIVNRPSRFDERIFVDMPNERARLRYLQHSTRGEEISPEEIGRWVDDTKDFSVAHMRELVVAVFCLGQEYQDVLDRLRKMRVQPKSGNEFGGGLTGFATTTAMSAKASQERRVYPPRI